MIASAMAPATIQTTGKPPDFVVVPAAPVLVAVVASSPAGAAAAGATSSPNLVKSRQQFCGRPRRPAASQPAQACHRPATTPCIAEACRPFRISQGHFRRAFGEPCGATIAFKHKGVVLRRRNILHVQLAFELGCHRPDTNRHCGHQRSVVLAIKRFTAEHALLEHGRIIQCDQTRSRGAGSRGSRSCPLQKSFHFHRYALMPLALPLPSACARSAIEFRLCTGTKVST